MGGEVDGGVDDTAASIVSIDGGVDYAASSLAMSMAASLMAAMIRQ